MTPPRHLLPVAVLAGALACKCGSSGKAATSWTAGVFQPSATFAEQCANPRTGTDPATGMAFPDTPGSTLLENNWLRSPTQTSSAQI